MEELLSLKWNNHRTTFIHILGVLRDKQAYTDVTLACDGKFYSVHKLVLSTCSDYFCAMFDKTACKSPVIVLKDIKSEDLEALLDYMYLGEVNVRQSDLASLIKAAENLRIKGLAVPDDEPPNKSSGGGAHKTESSRRDVVSSSPPAKRKRRDEGEDGREDVRPQPTHSRTLQTPPPTRPKSPVSHRLSPSPHRTSQESPSAATTATAAEDRASRPLSSPAEPSQTSLTSSQPTTQSSVSQQPSTNQYRSDETPSFVKVEMEEDHADDMQDSYDLSTDGYKEEGNDSGSGMNNDLPEFLQAAASGALSSGTGSYPHSFAGPSGYQAGDLASWQGDGSIGFPPHLNFSTSEGSSQQNAPGASGELATGVRGIPQGQLGQGDLHRAFDVAGATPIVGLECPVCGKRFLGRNRRQNLEHHLVTHTGERRYPCPLCPHRAAHKWHLKTHLLRRHAQHPALSQLTGTASHPDNVQSHVGGHSQQAQV